MTATFILLTVPEHLSAPAPLALPGGGEGIPPGGGINDSRSVEGVDQIVPMYVKLINVCRLPAIHAIFLYLATIQVFRYTTSNKLTTFRQFTRVFTRKRTSVR